MIKNKFIFLLIMSIVETHPEIAKQWHPTKNGDLKPENYRAGSKEKVFWKCNIGCNMGCEHIWPAAINDRCGVNKSGCPYCSKYQKKICYHKSIAYLHEELSKRWHPTKNYRDDAIDGEYFPGSQISPSELSDGSGYKAWWLCPNTNCSEKCAHEYKQRIVDKIGQNRGCPLCNGNQQRCYHNTLAYLHPELSKEWHPTKNFREDAIDGEYFPGSQISPSELSDGGKKPFWWKCLIECKYGCIHEWEAQVGNRTTAESKCPYCTIGTTKVCIHQSVGYLYPYLLIEWDYDKNKALDPYKIPFKSAIPANWICKNCNSEYNSVIYHRTNGGGCPNCIHKTVAKLLDYIKKYYPDVFTELKLDKCKSTTTNKYYPFDFCIPSLKTIIELDGRQHFIHIKLFKNNVEESIERDIYKMNQAEAEGYKVIRIFQEDVYKNDESWLETNLLPHIKNSDRIPVFISVDEDLYDEHIRVYGLGE